MRPKCEGGWHWSGRAYICEACCQKWMKDRESAVRRWRPVFGLDPDTGQET